MPIKHKLILLGVLVFLIAFFQFMCSGSVRFVQMYAAGIFYPLQSVRSLIFSFVPFSFGDCLYILLGLFLLVVLLRWIYFISAFGRSKEKLGSSILYFFIFLAFILLGFIIGWGGNYYKPSLSEYWQLKQPPSRQADSTALVKFHILLTDRLNTIAPKYRQLPEKEVNDLARSWYRGFTNCKDKDGLSIKNSLFGPVLERLGIDGYYNPFTGEGQINNRLPGFLLPFLYTHEMAHQAGIADEEDANLLAYALGTLTDDPSFNYSATLNVWLYTNARVMHRDTLLGKTCLGKLNPLTRRHLDTLDELAKKYDNAAARASTGVYDDFLKANNQKAGVHGYGNVSRSAALWEEKVRTKGRLLLKLP